jgi:hypothetical protein
MALISRNAQTAVPVVVAKEVDLAGAAASDVFAGPTVPANSLILGGYIEVTEAHAGTSTDMTIDVGITGGDVDFIVDGFDMDAASVSDRANNGVQTQTLVQTEDTVDVLVATQTGTTTAGKVKVCVIVLDTSAVKTPGLATVGS